MKYYRKVWFLIFIVTLCYFILNSTVKNIVTYKKISNFKNECDLVESLSNDKMKVYSVSRETQPSSFSFQNGIVNPGAFGDIIVKTEASLNVPFVKEITTFFVGGHAAYCANDYKDDNIELSNYQVIETALNKTNNKVFIADKDYWEDLDFTYSYIILRVNLTDAQKDVVFKKMISFIGQPYNLTFLLNTKKSHYCSDLIKKGFNSVNINLNQDGFVTTIHDLIVSKKVKIVGFKDYNPTTKISSYYGVNL